MNFNKNKPVVAGAVFHVLPENIPKLEEYLYKSPFVEKVIIFKESNNKLWLVEREGSNDGG